MMATLARRIAALTLLLVALLAAFGAPARAEPLVAHSGDAPTLLAPHQLVIPPLPGEFTTRAMGGWLTVAFPRGAAERVEPILPDLERFRAQLRDHLGQPVLERVEVRVVRDFDEMKALAPVGAPPPAYASGVAYGPLKLVLVSMIGPRAAQPTRVDETLRHELVHIALDDAFGSHNIPRWFNEGLAVHESGESHLERVETLSNASLSNTIFPMSEVDRAFLSTGHDVDVAYAQSADFVRFLQRRTDRSRFIQLVERVKGGQPFERALSDAYGSDLRKLEFQWRKELSQRFTLWSIAGSLVSVLMVGLFVLAWWKRRKRAQATLARWEAEESAVDEALRQAAAARAQAELPVLVSIQARALPKIEHGGGWHTLH